MCSKIFYLTLLVCLVSQTITITVPQWEKDFEQSTIRHEEFENITEDKETYFQKCSKRTVPAFTNLNVVRDIFKQVIKSGQFEDNSKSLNKEAAEIQDIFTEIIDVVNNTDISEIEQVLPAAMNNTANKIVYFLLSGSVSNIKTKVRMVANISKQLMAVLVSENHAFLKDVLGDVNNKLVMTSILKEDPEFFLIVTESMEEIIYEVDRYLENNISGEIIGAATSLFEQATRKVIDAEQNRNNAELSESTASLMEELSKEVQTVLKSDEVASTKLTSVQCMVEDSMSMILWKSFFYIFESEIN